VALVAGASDGIGAAFAQFYASQGMDLILIARNKEKLEKFANELKRDHDVEVQSISCDLSDSDATTKILDQLNGKEVDVFTYNAALSFITPFEGKTANEYRKLGQVNMITPMTLVHHFASSMIKRKKGAIILMTSLAGFQGSGYLAAYAATKAFNRVLAESLWYEWKEKGIDVIACCAGATSTPGYIATEPEKSNPFAPKVQKPEEVVSECMRKLGKQPSYITGRGNRIASFLMQRLLPRKMAITIMGDTTRKMYRL